MRMGAAPFNKALRRRDLYHLQGRRKEGMGCRANGYLDYERGGVGVCVCAEGEAREGREAVGGARMIHLHRSSTARLGKRCIIHATKPKRYLFRCLSENPPSHSDPLLPP